MLLKKKLGHSCFPVSFVKLRAPFLFNASGGCFFKFLSPEYTEAVMEMNFLKVH